MVFVLKIIRLLHKFITSLVLAAAAFVIAVYHLFELLYCSRACYGVLRFVMESGAKGCEVCIQSSTAISCHYNIDELP